MLYNVVLATLKTQQSKSAIHREVSWLLRRLSSEDCASAAAAGALSLISGLGRSAGGGHGHPLQYSGLENSVDRGAWRATVYRLA